MKPDGEAGNSGEQRKRLPMQPTKIGDLPAKGRVAVIGRVVDFTDNSMIVDDGTGSIIGIVNGETHRESDPEKGSLIRAIGKMQDNQMLTEIIQNFTDFDTESYDKAAQAFRSEVL